MPSSDGVVMWQLPSSGTIRALVWLSGEQLCLGVQAADTCLLATEHFAGGYSIFFFFYLGSPH